MIAVSTSTHTKLIKSQINNIILQNKINFDNQKLLQEDSLVPENENDPSEEIISRPMTNKLIIPQKNQNTNNSTKEAEYESREVTTSPKKEIKSPNAYYTPDPRYTIE